jgi:hypothetical protein
MAQRSMRRDRDNQLINQCREHVCLIWTRSADSHPGPRPVSRMTGRTHGSPDHALDQTEDFSCVTRGVYTWRLHMVDNAVVSLGTLLALTPLASQSSSWWSSSMVPASGGSPAISRNGGCM